MSNEFVYDSDLIAPFIAEARKRRLAKPFLYYILATAHHETGGTMATDSIENLNYTTPERLMKVWPSRFKTVAEAKPYVRNPEALANKVYANRMGNGDEASGDGWKFRGRTFVQITGRDNYAEFSVRLGVDLIARPDLAFSHAIPIIFDGMMDGLFTGQSLRKYIKPGVKADYVSARQVVNGMDQAELIAGYAGRYSALLADVDLVSESKTIAAAKSQMSTSTVGALASVGAVIKGVVDAAGDDTAGLVDAARQGSMLADIVPWVGTGAAVIFVGLFIYQRMQAKKIEAERVAIAERG